MKYSLKLVYPDRTEPTKVIDAEDIKEIITSIQLNNDAIGFYIQKLDSK